LPGVIEIAERLPFIKVVKLQESDFIWGTHLNNVLMQNIDPNIMIEAFKHSDFLIDSNVKQLHAIYSQ
jgi:hypothetical protein